MGSPRAQSVSRGRRATSVAQLRGKTGSSNLTQRLFKRNSSLLDQDLPKGGYSSNILGVSRRNVCRNEKVDMMLSLSRKKHLTPRPFGQNKVKFTSAASHCSASFCREQARRSRATSRSAMASAPAFTFSLAVQLLCRITCTTAPCLAIERMQPGPCIRTAASASVHCRRKGCRPHRSTWRRR